MKARRLLAIFAQARISIGVQRFGTRARRSCKSAPKTEGAPHLTLNQGVGLRFGTLKNGIVYFDAVGHGHDARFDAVAAILSQDGAIRHEGALGPAIIVELAHELHRLAARRRWFFILKPENAIAFRANVIPGRLLVFVYQVKDIQIQSLLLFLAYHGER